MLILTLFACPFISLAEQLKINDDAPTTYIVKKGDTLWDISSVFLNQPWLWPKLWRLNPEIKNPHLIYPGDTISLIFDENGEPQLLLKQVKVNQVINGHLRFSQKTKARYCNSAITFRSNSSLY